MLVAKTSNLGFACTLYMKCHHSKHGFTVEPMCVPFRETQTEPNSPSDSCYKYHCQNVSAGGRWYKWHSNGTRQSNCCCHDSNDASTHENVDSSSVMSKITIGNDHNTCNELLPINKWGRPLKTQDRGLCNKLPSLPHDAVVWEWHFRHWHHAWYAWHWCS